MKEARAVALLLASLSLSLEVSVRASELGTQARGSEEGWLEAERRVKERMERQDPGAGRDGALSARGAAVPLRRLDLSGLPEWDTAAASAAFAEARDLRFLYLPERPDFLRRISWMYPDDGCFARAAYAGKRAAARGLPRPAKIFMFGDLSVRTRNAPGGRVFWWYHVASLVSVAGAPWVIDPAVDPAAPLPLKEWIRRLSPDPGQALFARCSPHAYAHYSVCRDAPASAEADAPSDEGEFLRMEWNRMLELGRDPGRELGDDPPWKRDQ